MAPQMCHRNTLEYPQSIGKTSNSLFLQTKKWRLKESYNLLTITQLGTGKAGMAIQCVLLKLF